MIKTFLSLLFGLLLFPNAGLEAQIFASWTKTELTLNNGIVERTIRLPADRGNLTTLLYKPVQGGFRYFNGKGTDFQFELNNIVYSGKTNWQLKQVAPAADAKQGNGATVVLVSSDKTVELSIQFLLYPGLPVIRKNLVLKNISKKTLRLESVDVEKLEVSDYWATTFSWICHDYGRRRSIEP